MLYETHRSTIDQRAYRSFMERYSAAYINSLRGSMNIQWLIQISSLVTHFEILQVQLIKTNTFLGLVAILLLKLNIKG